MIYKNWTTIDRFSRVMDSLTQWHSWHIMYLSQSVSKQHSKRHDTGCRRSVFWTLFITKTSPSDSLWNWGWSELETEWPVVSVIPKFMSFLCFNCNRHGKQSEHDKKMRASDTKHETMLVCKLQVDFHFLIFWGRGAIFSSNFKSTDAKLNPLL